VRGLYPPEKNEPAGGHADFQLQIAKLGRFSGGEKRASILMGLTVVLWMTEFIHRISPAMIGLGAGLAACLPRIGIVDSEDFRRVDPLPIILVGAILSMPAVLVETRAIDVLNAVSILDFAKSHNLSSLASVIMFLAAGGKIFLYQSPVLVAGYSYGHFEPMDLFKVGFVLTVVESVILMFLVTHS
jgi:di/tricarboxylate transporter